jgi:hypothetical protein
VSYANRFTFLCTPITPICHYGAPTGRMNPIYLALATQLTSRPRVEPTRGNGFTTKGLSSRLLLSSLMWSERLVLPLTRSAYHKTTSWRSYIGASCCSMN